MASLGELLPVILAGIGGAASPRGADVFNNMAEMMNRRQQEKIRSTRDEERLNLARQAAEREQERLDLTKEETRASASLREINAQRDQEKYDREQEQLGILKAYKEQAISGFDPEDPQTTERTLAIQSAKDVNEVDKMLKRYGMPSVQDRIKAAEETGLAYQFEQDGVTYRGGGKKETVLGNPTDKIILDMMDDPSYKSDFKELTKLDVEMTEALANSQKPRLQKDDGTYEGESAIEASNRINALRKPVVRRMLKRAMLLSKGDQSAFADQVEEIFKLSGMSKKEFSQMLGIKVEDEAPAGDGADLDSLANDIASGFIPNNSAAGVTTKPDYSNEGPGPSDLGGRPEGIVSNTLRILFGGGGGSGNAELN